MKMEEKFDNPVWTALEETHKKFALITDEGRFYKPEICPFAAIRANDQIDKALAFYADQCKNFFFVNKEPIRRPNFPSHQEVFCDQMILENFNAPTYTHTIVPLQQKDKKALYDLVWKVMPGYYKEETFSMGNYYGVFDKEKLIAATGERLQTHDFIEVSAVVTDPDYQRMGLAKQLVGHTTEGIIAQGKTPILHVASSNQGAIALYRKLGYIFTQKMVWTHFIL